MICIPQIMLLESRRIMWVRHIACIAEKGNACRVLVGKHVKRCRRRWEDKINPLMPELIAWFLNVGCIIKVVLGCTCLWHLIIMLHDRCI